MKEVPFMAIALRNVLAAGALAADSMMGKGIVLTTGTSEPGFENKIISSYMNL